MAVTTHEGPSRAIRLLGRLYFGPNVRVRTWKKLQTQMRNGMRLEESLRQLQLHAKTAHSPLAEIYGHILSVLGHGRTLDVALDGLATREEIMLIGSGLSTGKLPEGLGLAMKVLGAQMTIRKSVRAALAGPIISFLACIALFVFVAVYIMPQLMLVFDPRTFTGSAWLLHVISSFLASPAGVIAGILLLIAIVLVILSFPRWTGPARRIADRCLPWSIYRLTVGTVWLYTIATRAQAGHQLTQILEGMTTGKTTPYLREIVGLILRHSRHGEDFGTALRNSETQFPSKEIVEELQVYARMPGFQERMAELADTWIVDGVELVKKYAQRIAAAADLLVIAQLVLVTLASASFETQFGGI